MPKKQSTTASARKRRLHGVVSRAERLEAAAARRRERVLQLSNDLSEDMPMGRWSRKDLMEAITYWNDRACESAQILAAYRSTLIIKAAEMLHTAQHGERWN